MSETPKCKNHPTRNTVLRKDGKSTGVCKECLDDRAEKMRTGRKKTKK